MIRLVGAFALLAATTASVWAQNETKAPPAEKSAEEERRYFTEDEVAPMLKPASYDVTIVEYMDYQCPHCRTTHKPLMELAKKDKKVRVIFRDWPVFGPASVSASLAAIASKYQGKHIEMHGALMATPLPLTNTKIKAAAKKAGVDWVQLEQDQTKHSAEIEDLLQRNDHQAQVLGLQGTPSFIIGNIQSFGGLSLKQLESSVARARSDAKK